MKYSRSGAEDIAPTEFEVGYVARARGLVGEVIIKTFDPGSETLLSLRRVVLRARSGATREICISSACADGNNTVVCFKGVASRTEAEALVGSTVLVLRVDLSPPGDGEYFQGDLIGLVAIDEQGVELGRVENIWSTGPVPNVVISGVDGSELIVPFADDFVRTVDLPNRRIVVRLPEFME